MNNQLAITEQSVSDSDLIMYLDNLGLTTKLTAGEKNTFLQIAKAYNLNPFKREIHASKYGDQMSIITGYEVYIKRAERSGQLDGWSAKTSGSVATNDLKAIVTIYRKDRQHPFEWEASYNEFVQKTNLGAVTKFWQKADFMIKKVAISQAFRLCFSDELGGMPYTKEEMPETEDVTAEVISTQIKTPPPPPTDQKPAAKKLTEKQFAELLDKIATEQAIEEKKKKVEILKSFALTSDQSNKIIALENDIANLESTTNALRTTRGTVR